MGSSTAGRTLLKALLGLSLVVGAGCREDPAGPEQRTVPQQERWGIYRLELATGDVELIHATELAVSGLALDPAGTRLAFAMKAGPAALDTSSEIYSIGTDGTGERRLTNNTYFDAYPSFSPDGSKVIFLSKRNGTLDLYVMNVDGSDQLLLYDSGGHDADVDWGRNGDIVFTRDHQIWLLPQDGTGPRQVTAPADAGRWGSANLPVGDYDPRLSPDCTRIVFERLEDPERPHGGYDIFLVHVDGTGERRLTDNGYAQGLASWSDSGDRIVYTVAAIDGQGRYRIYMINADGTGNRNVTPAYFPTNFLVHQAIFARDERGLYFIAEWWD